MPFDAGTDDDVRRSLEVKLGTMQQNMDRVTEKCASLREALCAKERSDGTLVINFEALVEKLGPVACLELRAAIDERWRVSGEAGQKPRMRVTA